MKDLQCSVVVPIVYDATEDVSVAIGRHGFKEIASDNLAARRDLWGTERLCTGDHIRQVVEHTTHLWDCREDPGEERAMTAAHVDDRSKQEKSYAARTAGNRRADPDVIASLNTAPSSGCVFIHSKNRSPYRRLKPDVPVRTDS